MENRNQKVYATGLWLERRDNAPEYVAGKMSINVKSFVEWLQTQPTSDKGYLNLDVVRKKNQTKEGVTEYSVSLNTYQP